MELLAAFLKSKKAGAFLLGLIVLVLTQVFGLDEEAAKEIAQLIMAYIIGQGLADMRK